MKTRLTAAAVCLAATALPALAQVPPPDDGRLLASGCFQCHGTNGRGGFDSLAGKSASELLKELGEMRVESARKEIMNPHARGYTTYQLQLIANYFARQPKP